MDSKFIKATLQKSTGKPSAVKVQVLSTERPSAELKNSSQAGIDAENLVAEDLINRKCKILKQRFRTPFAEVDLIVRNQKNQIVLVEVKTLSRWEWVENRITQKQTVRLKRAMIYLEKYFNESMILCAAFVVGQKVYYVILD